MRLNFNDVPKYFTGKPHQLKAFEVLEKLCPDSVREEFTRVWRGEPEQSPSKILDYVAQPDDATCQSACIAKAIGTTDVMQVRRELLASCREGEIAGSPSVMGRYLRSRVKFYQFNATGSINDICEFLQKPEGRMVITHGWFTASGHVISIVGAEKKGFIVDDPYGEFSFSLWQYIRPVGNDRLYSYAGIYAACVAGGDIVDAKMIYARGELKMDFGNAWVHFIEN